MTPAEQRHHAIGVLSRVWTLRVALTDPARLKAREHVMDKPWRCRLRRHRWRRLRGPDAGLVPRMPQVQNPARLQQWRKCLRREAVADGPLTVGNVTRVTATGRSSTPTATAGRFLSTSATPPPEEVTRPRQRCSAAKRADDACQQVVSNDPTSGLASHHRALSRSLPEQGWCDAGHGGGGRRDVVRMVWHARGQGSNPLSSTRYNASLVRPERLASGAPVPLS
jgi:hypothetical protein